ncbi:hypothetical protein GGG16DRAFT_55395 [Schizophyllum commune]
MPIHNLPLEILHYIFILCIPRGRHALYYDYGDPDNLGAHWASPSQVCRRWRELALGSKRLWAIAIPFDKPFWMYTALRRAGDLPLTFDIDLERSEVDHCVAVAALHIGQLVELSISGTYIDLQRILKKLRHDAAPLLEELRLLCPEGLSELTRRYPEWCYIPDILQSYTGVQPPRLQTLELEGCYLPVESNLYLGITTFVLRNPPNISGWDDGAVYDLIEGMPQLQSLSLCPAYDLPYLRPGQTVALPDKFTDLRLVGHSDEACAPTEGELEDLERLIVAMRFPAENWNLTWEVHSVEHMASVLSVSVCYPKSLPSNVDVSLRAWEDDDGTDRASLELRIRTVASAEMCIHVLVSDAPPNPVQALQAVLNATEEYHVVEFSARGFHYEDMNDPRFILGDVCQWRPTYMPRVQRWLIDALPPALILECMLVRRMQAVGPDTAMHRRGPEDHVPQIFPGLQCIRIRGIDLSTPLVSFRRGRLVDGEARVLPLVLMIVWACVERHRLGLVNDRVPHVAIEYCMGVDPVAVDALRTLTSVEWDGRGGTSKQVAYVDVREAVLEDYVEMTGECYEDEGGPDEEKEEAQAETGR